MKCINKRILKRLIMLITTLLMSVGIVLVTGNESNAGSGSLNVNISSDGILTWGSGYRSTAPSGYNSYVTYDIKAECNNKKTNVSLMDTYKYNLYDRCVSSSFSSGLVKVHVEAVQHFYAAGKPKITQVIGSGDVTYNFKAPKEKLATPQNFNISRNDKKYSFKWDNVPNASKYILLYSINNTEEKTVATFSNCYEMNLADEDLNEGSNQIKVKLYATASGYPDSSSLMKEWYFDYYEDGLVITLNLQAKEIHDEKTTVRTLTDGCLSRVPTATREGFILNSWYSYASSYDGEKVTTNTKFTRNTEIFARWTPLDYSIKVNGGYVYSVNDILNKDENTDENTDYNSYSVHRFDKIVICPKPISSDYKFLKWIVTKGNLKLSEREKTAEKLEIFMKTEDIELKAIYEYSGEKHDVWYYMDQPVAGQSPYNPTVNYEIFKCYANWTDVSSGERLKKDDTFKENGIYQAEIILVVNRSGEIDPSKFKTYINDKEVESSVTDDLNVVCYKKFQAKAAPCTVSFDANGGKGSIDPISVEKNSDFTLPEGYIFEAPEGKDFDKWDCGSWGTKVAGSRTRITEDVVIKALWKDKEVIPDIEMETCVVRFDTDGGTAINSQIVEKGGIAIEPELPYKDDYLFAGWYKDKDFTVKYDFVSEVYSDITIYAKWEKVVVLDPDDQNSETVSHNNEFVVTEDGTQYFKKDGNQAHSEWVYVNNKWYYINDEGYTASDEWIDGYWINADGSCTYDGKLVWRSNSTGWWVEDSKGWYPISMWEKIDGIWYYFNENGYMASEEYYNGYWFNADGSWNPDYHLVWKSNSSGWWVEDISGWWPSSKWLKIDGIWYYFDASGYMVTDQYIDGYWIGSDGACQ